MDTKPNKKRRSEDRILIQCRLKRELAERLMAKAEAEDLPLSAIIRRLCVRAATEN